MSKQFRFFLNNEGLFLCQQYLQGSWKLLNRVAYSDTYYDNASNDLTKFWYRFRVRNNTDYCLKYFRLKGSKEIEEYVLYDNLKIVHEIAAFLNLQPDDVEKNVFPIASVKFIRTQFVKNNLTARLDQCYFPDVKHTIFMLEIVSSQSNFSNEEQALLDSMNNNFCLAPRKIEVIFYLRKQLQFLPKEIESDVQVKMQTVEKFIQLKGCQIGAIEINRRQNLSKILDESTAEAPGLKLNCSKLEPQKEDVHPVEKHMEISSSKEQAIIREIRFGANVKYFIRDYISNPNIINCALELNGLALQYVAAHATIQQVKIAVKSNPLALKFVRPELLEIDTIKEAVTINGAALQFVPEKFKSENVIQAAVSSNGLALKYAVQYQNHTIICRAAVENSGLAIQYCQLTSFSKDYSNLLIETAVKQNGLAIRFVKNPSEEIKKAAVNQNPIALQCTLMQPFSKEIEQLAILHHPRLVSLINWENYSLTEQQELLTSAVEKDRNTLHFIPPELETVVRVRVIPAIVFC